MPDCNNYEMLISAVLDGEATEAERDVLQRHMANCASCAALYRAYAAVNGELKNMEVTPPDTLAAGVMYKIKHTGKKRFAVGRFTALAAAAAVVILVGSYVLPGFGASKSTDKVEAPEMYLGAGAEADRVMNEPAAPAEPPPMPTLAPAPDQPAAEPEGDNSMTASMMSEGGAYGVSRGHAGIVMDGLEKTEDWLGVYIVIGQTPEALADLEPLAMEDGGARYEAEGSVIAAMEAEGLFSEVIYLNDSAEKGVVVVYPKEITEVEP